MGRLLKVFLLVIYLIFLQQFVAFLLDVFRNPPLSINGTSKFYYLQSHRHIPNFEALECDQLAAANTSEAALRHAKGWSYNMIDETSFMTNMDREQRCNSIISFFGFNTKPLSDEEEKYPLAYGILVYKWVDEVYYTMSAIYQPQNLYCIGIDNKSSELYKRNIGYLDECFPNIHVMTVPSVSYCKFSVLGGVHQCLRYLTESSNDWKYYQYLTGFDLPLKTNHEMVRIFKQLNETFNGEVTHFQHNRLALKKNETIPYGLKLFKSSLSATFSRKTAEYLAKSRPALDFLDFLNGTYCPDESFWTTMVGNKGVLDMPGSFNATKLLQIIDKFKKIHASSENPAALPYYISRYQSWSTSHWKACKGKYVSASCVFGVGDIATLLRRPHLVAHKFYLNYEPATYFCVYQKVRERARENINNFDAKRYNDLPGPRLSRDENIEEWFDKNIN